MRIAVSITQDFPLHELPEGVIYAPIPIHFQVAEGLAQKGHDVTLFCSEDTVVEAPLKKFSVGLDSGWKLQRDHPERHYGPTYMTAADQVLFSKMYELGNAGNYDLVWQFSALRGAAYLPFAKLPTLFTLHDPLNQYHALLRHYAEFNNHWYVSISNAQRLNLPDLRFIDTVYNGLDLSVVPFSADKEDYFVFFGRIVPEKGVLESIEVAKRAGVKLKVIGCPVEGSAYWEECRKHIDGTQVEYLGCLTKAELFPIVAKALGFINMVDVHESFGMALIESLACGTPVIARRRGSIPELIRDGDNGFVINTIEEAVQKLPGLRAIDYAGCRRFVEDRFSMVRCVDEYEKVMLKTTSLYSGA